MAKIDVKFMKGTASTAKQMGATYTKKKAAKPASKNTKKGK